MTRRLFCGGPSGVLHICPDKTANSGPLSTSQIGCLLVACFVNQKLVKNPNPTLFKIRIVKVWKISNLVIRLCLSCPFHPKNISKQTPPNPAQNQPTTEDYEEDVLLAAADEALKSAVLQLKSVGLPGFAFWMIF